MINISELSKIYYKNNEKIYANKNITLDILDGEIIGFLGANGAGKSTLIKMICNLINPSKGSILINQKNIKNNPDEVHKNIGVVLEGARNLYNFLTVDYNIKYFAYLNELDRKKLQEKENYLLKLFDLENKKDEVVNNLSRGMQQKVAIIIAILKDPNILILDEPTLGLDIMSKIKMIKLLKDLSKNYKKTLIICSHDMSVIEGVCDKIAFFENGQVTQYDTINNLKFNSNNMNYNIIVRNSENIRSLVVSLSKNIYEEDHDVISFNSDKVSEILNKIPIENIIKIEKQSNSIEDLFIKGVNS